MDLAGKKVAVLAAPGFEDSELSEPVNALGYAGAEVVLVALAEDDKQGIRGKRGTVVTADATIDEVDAGDFDAVVIPGGKSPAHLRRDQRILDLVNAVLESGKPVAAICHGPQVLAAAGALKGRTATSYRSVRKEVEAAGARFLDEPVVVDGNLITSRKPDDIPRFVNALIAALREQGNDGGTNEPVQGKIHQQG
ncbi:general stress protein 18 [bacterium BMS3Abin01]|nr:general stress protein 18 [bacterium BMS3Abin01]HDY70017.1 type 1 glutamine amidotransferase [Actinomycetota bacterium]